MISVKGASFGRFGGWRRRYPGGSECRSIFLTVSRAMPNRLAASRWLRPSTWQASRTRRYRSTVYILPPSISKKIEGYRWQSFTPPAAGKSRPFRGLICHRRSHRSHSLHSISIRSIGKLPILGRLRDLIIGGLNSFVTMGCREGLTLQRYRLASSDAHHPHRADRTHVVRRYTCEHSGIETSIRDFIGGRFTSHGRICVY